MIMVKNSFNVCLFFRDSLRASVVTAEAAVGAVHPLEYKIRHDCPK